MVFLTTFSLFATAQPTIRDQNSKDLFNRIIVCSSQRNISLAAGKARFGSSGTLTAAIYAAVIVNHHVHLRN